MIGDEVVEAHEVKSLAVPRKGLIEGDLSQEVWRRYQFADGSTYEINDPVRLFTRPGGTTHRVLDESGYFHLIAFPGPAGSTTVTWLNKDALEKTPTF